MVQIGKRCGKKMTAVLTNMDEPLGKAVGNSLEVIEAIETLNGNGPDDFVELCLTIASHLVVDAGKAADLNEARLLLKQQIANKAGLKTLGLLVEAQGGNKEFIFNPQLFKKARYQVGVYAKTSGFVAGINALSIGNAAMMLGAGRRKMSDQIDHSVGIVLSKKVGDSVEKGDLLAMIHANKEDIREEAALILEAYRIADTAVYPQLILDVVK